MSEVIVKSAQGHKYTQNITAGDYKFTADVDDSMGGENEGPNPHQLMLGSLGACTSITIQMYAERKGWALEEVTVSLTEEKTADPENPSRNIPKVNREITIKGTLDDEQVESLKKIADKCPVHKLLSGKKEITTSMRKS